MAPRFYLLHAVTPFAFGLALGLAACGEQAADIAEAPAAEGQDMDAMAAAPAAEPAVAGRTPAPAGASVSFGNLTDGQMVTSPLDIEFIATGIGVTAAGDQAAGTGHHHLLIDTTVDGLDLNAPIPNDDNHRHFGMAQTGTTVELTPGMHTLQLVMGDWTHIPHDPVVASPVITITVE